MNVSGHTRTHTSIIRAKIARISSAAGLSGWWLWCSIVLPHDHLSRAVRSVFARWFRTALLSFAKSTGALMQRPAHGKPACLSERSVHPSLLVAWVGSVSTGNMRHS